MRTSSSALASPPKETLVAIFGFITFSRIRLCDGRHLAYRERGVSKENAKYKVIVVHGFDSFKDIYLPLSQELMDEVGVYMVSFDRAGYGENDPNPKWSVRSEAFDIQELADQLKLGPRFYIIGMTLGTYPLPSAMIAPIAVALAVGFLGWAYQALKPPPPKICGSPDGPPITSPRVKLSDGRHLAYRESGVPKEEAKYKIIVVHGFDSSKDLGLPVPQELIEELKIYILFFDRAGYGDSDPYPSRSVKSEAFDIQELADQLQIGSKFYVIGISMGAYPIWSCLKYIPHRLSGASLVVPFVNYWWPIFPANLAREAFKTLPTSYQRSFQIAHHTPWLFYWWMTQTWFPSLITDQGAMFGDQDLEILKSLLEAPSVGQEKIKQQGVYESLHRDILAGYGKWEFDLLDINNPFPDNEGAVHIWQGYADRIISFKLNRYISEKLPWIRYHEVTDGGHLMIFKSETCEAILRALLLG